MRAALWNSKADHEIAGNSFEHNRKIRADHSRRVINAFHPRRNLERPRSDLTRQASRRRARGIVSIYSNPSFPQKLGRALGIREWNERMKRATAQSHVSQSRLQLRLDTARSVEKDRS
jgi:hypothetical protein